MDVTTSSSLLQRILTRAGCARFSFEDTKCLNNFYKNLPVGSHDVSHNIYAEKNFHYDAIPKGQDNLKIHGYFQSEKYFNNNRDKIISLLNVPALKEQVRQKYGDYSNHISIHVRRGDYLELSDFHHNLNIDYYKNRFFL